METTEVSQQASVVFHLQNVHRLEVALLQARIEILHAVLREHGIEPPDEDPRLGASDGEHLELCRNVVRSAYDLLGLLDELRAMVGSGTELLKEENWRARSSGSGVREH